MSLKGAFLAIAASGASLLVAACGGGVDSGSSQSQPGSAGDVGQLQVNSGDTGNGAGTGGGGSNTGNNGTGSNSGTGSSIGSGSVNDCSSVVGAGVGSGSSNNIGSGALAQYVAIDLCASGYRSMVGWAIGDGEQAGEGTLLTPHSEHRALLWRGSASTVVDLHPYGWSRSRVYATSGGIQVGSAEYDDNRHHAFKWAGSASSAVDLDPANLLRYSDALGVSGDQIVGLGGSPEHALMWTSRGLVDLHPNGYGLSGAWGTDGAQQVGNGWSNADHKTHALLWTGSASSVVDLHPNQYCFSLAWGVSGGQQVGYGGCDPMGRYYGAHALLWTGSAQSVVDLHPSQFRDSLAQAVSAGRQVGWGTTADGSTHALLWNGTAESVVDLHAFLPAGFRNSQAHGIDASGNIIGSADGHAILWRRQ